MSTSQTPNINHGIIHTTENEIVFVEVVRFSARGILENVLAKDFLFFFPFVIMAAVEVIDIGFSKDDCFLKVEHCVIRTNPINRLQVRNHDVHDFTPGLEFDFSTFKHGKVKGAFFMIICRVENRRDGEGFRNQIVTLEDCSLAPRCNRPSDIINQRFGDCQFLFVIGGEFPFIDKGKRCGFRVENHITYCLAHVR